MKNTILILTVFVLSSFYLNAQAVNTLEGNTLTEFGKYTITPSENYVVVDDVAYKTWDLYYAGTQKSYQIIYKPGVNERCCFTIKSDDFEIQYAKQSKGFGVKLVEAGNRTIKKKEIMSKIDYDKFVNQIVLTSKDKTVEEYLGLVACFMPLLFG